MALPFEGAGGTYGPVSTSSKPLITVEAADEQDKQGSGPDIKRRSFFAVTGILAISAGLALVILQFGHGPSDAGGPVQTATALEDLPLVEESYASTTTRRRRRRRRAQPLKALTGKNWWLKDFAPGDIAKNMLYADCQGKTAEGKHVPAQWGGLWWMDGNPAPETVASFGRAKWFPGTNACQKSDMKSWTKDERKRNVVKSPWGEEVPCRGRIILEFAEDRIWSMPNTLVGRTYEEGGAAIRSTMEFVCGGEDPKNLTICKVGSNTGPKAKSKIGKFLQGLKGTGDQAFNKAARFSMVQVNANYWIRYSLDGVYPYHLKRIIGCNGKPVQPHWNQFMSNGKERPQFLKDVYGHGGDKRSHVAKVTQSQFVRWNTDPKPAGSGWVCAKDTGGRCHVFGCSSWRKATCKDHLCLCPKNHCRDTAGKCVPKPNQR